MKENPKPESPCCNPMELDRRSFLGWLTAGVTACIAAVLGGAGGGYFLSPAFQKQKENWVDIGATKDIPHGVPTKIDFVARKREAWVTTEIRSSAWILTSDGKDFQAFDPKCTHLGCPYRWDSQKKQFLCPCHTGVFDAEGNVVSGPPPRPLDRFPVKVARGRILVLTQPVQANV